MTVAALPSVIEYVENGVSLSFAAPFRFNDGANGLAIVRILAGNALLLTPGVDYSATGGSTEAGGTVVLAGSVAGATLRITRATPISQRTDYTTGGRFPAQSHEEALDRLTMIAQEQNDRVTSTTRRALMVPDGETAGVLPAAALRANRIAAYSALGAPIAGFTIDQVQAAILNATAALAGQTVAAAILFQGAGVASVARTAQTKMRDTVSAKDFGAAGDGVTDDRVKLQAAIDYLAGIGGGTLYLPVGTYIITLVLAADGTGVSGLTLKAGVEIQGESQFGSVIKIKNAQFGVGAYTRGITTNGQIAKCALRNFTFDGNRAGQGIYAQQGNGGNIVLNVKDCLIEGVRSIEANGQSIQVRGQSSAALADRVTIDRCIVDGTSGSTLNADGSVALEYNGNGIGIQVSLASDYSITNNRIRNCKDNGIDTYNDNGTAVPAGGGSVIAHNTVLSSRCGIFPETTARLIVAHNYIGGMVDTGIALNRINGAPTLVQVHDNQIEYCYYGIRVQGDCSSVDLCDNMIGFITSNSGAGIYLYNTSYVLIRGNTFQVNAPAVPLVLSQGSALSFCRISGNFFWGTPNLGYLTVLGATTTTATTIEDWQAIDNAGRGIETGQYFERAKAKLGTLITTGGVGFNGVAASGKVVLPAAATDAATTMALANALRGALITFGLGQ